MHSRLSAFLVPTLQQPWASFAAASSSQCQKAMNPTDIGNSNGLGETERQISARSAANEENKLQLDAAEMTGQRTDALVFLRSTGTTGRRVEGAATCGMGDPDPLLTLRTRVELLEQQMARLTPNLNTMGQGTGSVLKITADKTKSMLASVWEYARGLRRQVVQRYPSGEYGSLALVAMLSVVATIAAVMVWSSLAKNQQPEEALSSWGERPLWRRMHSELQAH
ncbi:hypothetical protein K474DRAFT_1708732 [Panus rudis PR-1116 ss-1]|nr:hypothetical protein K474DRAFT_1708732 [Panus rudis PR-1116 ss-1]